MRRASVAAGAGCVCACHREHQTVSLEAFGLRADWFPRSWQQRNVLTALLPPGTSVSSERLLDAVYGHGARIDCPNDRRALAVTVHRLRRALAGRGWTLRSVARHGYTLDRVAGC